MAEQPANQSRLAAIRGLRDYASELQAEIARLSDALATVGQSIRLLEGPEAQKANEPAPPATGGYSSLKPQAAVRRYHKEHPGKRLKASVLAKALLREGLPKTAKAFGSCIAAAQSRLEAKGLLHRGEDAQGRVVYWYEPPIDKEVPDEKSPSPAGNLAVGR